MLHDRRWPGAVLLCAVLLGLNAAAALAQQERCMALQKLDAAGLKIVSSELVPAGKAAAENAQQAALTGAATATGLPEHCLVRVQLDARSGAQGEEYFIGMELRLPTRWNGRFLYQGGGGMDGAVNPAIGSIPIHGSTAQPALERGYAVVSTDSGHQAKNPADASFGYDQQARLDLGYAAIGRVTGAAKLLVQSYYQKAPRHSYFMGCSNGGREALMAAERFPLEFDGVVAGNPGFHLSHAAIAEAWDTRAFLRAAPLDAAGKPVLANAFALADLQLVSSAILNQCDALDGAKDGIIEAMSECRFDPRSLQCKGEKQAGCLTLAQVDALTAIFSGAVDSKGNRLYSTWPWDSGIDAPGWRAWKLGNSQTAQPNAINATMGAIALSHYFMTPPQESVDAAQVDFDRIAEQVAETGAINDATNTQLSSFAAHSGKLIVVEGNSDPVFSADDLREWWQRLAAANGGAEQLSATARLFIIPGMTHCGGGPALDDIDPLTALEQWVETGAAPQQLMAKGTAFPGRARPVCPYPEGARYNGNGDVNAASSFRCVAPAGR